jgi:hypothetical protein
MAGALIVTAEIGPGDLVWLERLRRAHYPAERNRVPAHLIMFHALPPSAEGEVRRSLARLASGPPPKARIEGLMNLGGGVAFRIVSTDLDQVRRDLAEDFHGLLGAQCRMMDTSFFLARQTLLASSRPGMAIWREKLFAWMLRNAESAMEFFKLPTNRVVELGSQVEI